ncbi:UDP-2,4-diacetamido-2,4,6-trideoxy-beta-L-altropyranose hydrolase [Paenibacillus sp. OV219]|uniref:UDP-2,4-diacetamido-2,4, 6-trideoxy-beta-L-altropyranose hydrolase n=1 Tax=Paenibacillus sp. OV219 TaxID=1884377 RepID=UPI0008B8C67C|nr:UDP-2,4-diacetamido-2,4,6-trideoxy-beta-L-altropyranose hydrolase [Paenibacillus sp. OV219]SEN65568.1 UDP-2,4-diacetamido-2,4,6-trideoxy-beta-L-altropyranose hydrolase [Paenibacillus sp. OV219]
MKQIVFRVDASSAMGTGHMMRCLTLADELSKAKYGCRSLFICRPLEGNLGAYLLQRGYEVEWIEDERALQVGSWADDADRTIHVLKQWDADWLVVDHYGIDSRWEEAVRPYAKQVLVIDDLANRKHCCDLLLDQNAYADMHTRYENLVEPECRLLLGPKYLLLRPLFYTMRRSMRERTGKVQRLLLFFGGSDPTNETVKALQAVDDLRLREQQVDVVIGEANPFRQEVIQRCDSIPNVTLHVQVENMAELLVGADFALGAGGIAMWERCYLGLPSAVTVVADNQIDSVGAAEQAGAIWAAGGHEQTSAALYADRIHKAMHSPEELLAMSRRAFELTESRTDITGNQVASVMMDQGE